jgi:hypothetical protein
MADIHARMRQLILSAADWTATDPVLGLGEIGLEAAAGAVTKAKVGDGVKKWSALPTWSTGGGGGGTPVTPGVVKAYKIALNGTVSAGIGVTCAKPQVGTYNLTLATPLASVAKTVVTATPLTVTMPPHACTYKINSTTSITITTWAIGNNAHTDDSEFSLMIVEVA